jgi:hypothetical protein
VEALSAAPAPGSHATAQVVALQAPEIATSTTVRPLASAMLHPPAGTIGDSLTGRKIVSTLAATASRETDAADVSRGARLHYSIIYLTYNYYIV